MIYKDYLDAARMHKIAADKLYMSAQTENSTKIKCNILSIYYYLTGYIIECSVKYGIMALYGHDKRKDVKKFREKGLEYSDLQKHQFASYVKHIYRFNIDTEFLSKSKKVDKNIENLYNNWDVTIRYKYNICYDKHVYKQFNDIANKILDSIQQRTVG